MSRNGTTPSKTGRIGLTPGTTVALSPKQESAAIELARGATLDEASKASGAGVTTLKTWQVAVPAFNSRVAELRSAMTDRVFGKVVDAMCEALDALRRLAKAGKTEATQVKAAEVILTHGAEAIEARDLKARIEALEAGR